jgi:hypothetical protein
MLNGSRILTVIGQLVAAAVPQHVAMNRERKACGLARAGNHPLIASDAERCQALRDEHIDALWCLTL